MMTENIKIALVRYLTRSATPNDLNLLSEWLKTASNRVEFEAFINDYYAINYTVNTPDTGRAVKRLLHTIKQKKELARRKKTPLS